MDSLRQRFLGLQMAGGFISHMESAEKAKKLNQQPPKPRPHRDPASERIRWKAQYPPRQNTNMFSFGISTTIVTGESHSSRKSLDELKPIKLREMKVPLVHKGMYLTCRTAVDPSPIISANTMVEDLDGDIEELALYNFSYNTCDVSWIPLGTIMIIKEPYLRYGSQDQTASLRVDSPSDVIFVDPTDLEVLKKVGAQKWHVKESTDVDEIRKQGNDCFNKKKYERATFFYDRAIRYAPDNPVLYLNKASSCLRSGYGYLAYEAAKAGMEKGGDREKALHRLGLAAYLMRDWKTAAEHFQVLKKEFPNNTEADKELKRANARIVESQTGKFNWMEMYLNSRDEYSRLDVADYTGPIKISDIPGKGRGIVASKDIRKGTLLVVSKPFASGYPQDYPGQLMALNLIRKTGNTTAHKLQMVKAIDNLRKNPKMSKKIYALYAGDLPRDEQIPEGVIDTARIEHISTYNRFSINDKVKQEDEDEFDTMANKDACGLYIIPAYFNHSCLGNSVRKFYGDIMVVHATKDLKKGDEITLAYIGFPSKHEERRKKLEEVWGFKCRCRVCEMENESDQNGLNSKRLKLSRQFRDIFRSNKSTPQVVINKGEPLLKQMRDTYKDYNGPKFYLTEILIGFGVMCNNFGKIDLAVKYFEEAVSLFCEETESEEGHVYTVLNLAHSYLQAGQPTKAKNMANKAFKSSFLEDKELFKMVYPTAAVFF